MVLSEERKRRIRQELVEALRNEPEVHKVVAFGSFVTSPEPRDLDVAIFQDTSEPYLPLAMKYRRLTRNIARQIPMDVLPIRDGAAEDGFLREITRGEVICERQ